MCWCTYTLQTLFLQAPSLPCSMHHPQPHLSLPVPPCPLLTPPLVAEDAPSLLTRPSRPFVCSSLSPLLQGFPEAPGQASCFSQIIDSYTELSNVYVCMHVCILYIYIYIYIYIYKYIYYFIYCLFMYVSTVCVCVCVFVCVCVCVCDNNNNKLFI